MMPKFDITAIESYVLVLEVESRIIHSVCAYTQCLLPNLVFIVGMNVVDLPPSNSRKNGTFHLKQLNSFFFSSASQFDTNVNVVCMHRGTEMKRNKRKTGIS